MDDNPNIEEAIQEKEQLLVVQFAITNALKEAEEVGKVRMCGKSKMEGLVFEAVLRGSSTRHVAQEGGGRQRSGNEGRVGGRLQQSCGAPRGAARQHGPAPP